MNGVKNMKKGRRFLFCLLAGLLLLGGCGKKGEQQEPGSSGEAQESVRQLPTSALTDCSIVYAESELTGELYWELQALQNAIEERFGVKLTVRNDFVKAGSQTYAEKEYEILVGNTNREESRTVYGELSRERDYTVRLCGKKVVLASLSADGILAAVKAFAGMLPEADGGVFFRESMEIFVQGDYAVDGLMLNGIDISDFTVVYENSELCRTLAEQITEQVRERSGVVLTAQTSGGSAVTAHRILVGNTDAGLPADWTAGFEGYYVGMMGEDLLLYGADTPRLCRAVNRLLDGLCAASTEHAEVRVQDGKVACDDHSMTSMSFNLLVNSVTPERIERVLTMIRRYMPDTLGVQEASEEWMAALREGLGEEYASVGIGRDAGGRGEHSAVFYRTAVFDVVESGTKWLSATPDTVSRVEGSICNRVFTYAVLQRKSDGSKFLCVNTHTDHATDGNVRLEQVKTLTEFLAQHPDLPTVISGDFNEPETESSIQYILSAGFINAAHEALETSNTPTFKTSVIDYFFLSPGDFTIFSYSVDDSIIDGAAPSDHNPILIWYELAG